MANEALDHETDESLALLVAIDKNRQAASILVDRYAPKLKGYLTEHFGKTLRDGVADAVQETFRRMLKYIASYNAKTGPFEGWMIGIAHKVALKMLGPKDKRTFKAFTDDPVFDRDPAECEENGDNVKGWQVKLLDDFVENRLKGFEQAIGRAYVATGGDIDAGLLMKQWGKSRNASDVTKNKVKNKFKELLIEAEKQRSREKGKT